MSLHYCLSAVGMFFKFSGVLETSSWAGADPTRKHSACSWPEHKPRDRLQ